MAVYQIECFGKIDKTYNIWSNAQLALNQAMKDEYIIWGSTSSKETSIMLILFVESLGSHSDLNTADRNPSVHSSGKSRCPMT